MTLTPFQMALECHNKKREFADLSTAAKLLYKTLSKEELELYSPEIKMPKSFMGQNGQKTKTNCKSE